MHFTGREGVEVQGGFVVVGEGDLGLLNLMRQPMAGALTDQSEESREAFRFQRVDRKALLIGLVYERDDTADVLEIQQGLLDGLAGSGFELVVRCFDHDGPELANGLRAFADGQKLFGLVLAPSMARRASRWAST